MSKIETAIATIDMLPLPSCQRTADIWGAAIVAIARLHGLCPNELERAWVARFEKK